MKKLTSLILGVILIAGILLPMGAYAEVIYSWGADSQRRNNLIVEGKVSVATTETGTEVLSVNGTVEVYSGGVKFPDGSVQLSANGTADVSAIYVDVAGDTMTGVLTNAAVDVNALVNGVTIASPITTGIATFAATDFDLNDLTNVGTADAAFEAVNKTQMDTADALKASLTGATFTGPVTGEAFHLTAGAQTITIIATLETYYITVPAGVTVTTESL
jgi:hypothetical protein